jgi:U8 snoRNA-decapping enzyme
MPCYHYDRPLGWENRFSRSILLHAYEEGDESHFMSEITGIKIIPLVQHAGKGINLFLENSFAGSAKDELLIMLKELFAIELQTGDSINTIT